jgi:hypothetical protein
MATLSELIFIIFISWFLQDIISSLISDFVLIIKLTKKDLLTVISWCIFYYLLFSIELHDMQKEKQQVQKHTNQYNITQ